MRFASAFLIAASFAALAALVAAGALTGLDQWAVDHVMPGARFTSERANIRDALIPFAGTRWSSGWSVAADVVTLPASFFVALALAAWRSRPIAVVLVAATAAETLCKHVLNRPPLHHGALHIVGFDSSFPSGHTLRSVLVAAAFAHPLAAAWAVASIVVLQLAGWHTPSDVAGGLLLAGLALLGARALRGRRLLRRRP
jgi:membrane-associated phospholipid phosphatase